MNAPYDDYSRETFSQWPLERQQRFLKAELDRVGLVQLFDLCAGQADTSPLLILLEEAQARQIALGAEFGSLLLTLATSTLHRVLQLPGLDEAAESAWRAAAVDDLVSFALLDRYLRRRSPARWDRCMGQTVAQAREILEAGDQPDSSLLLRLPGKEQRRLAGDFPDQWCLWEPTWIETVQQAVGVLARRPRDVSLANAERLLSQQVYTDQGHFLLELLQNADDSGARQFEVEFRRDCVVVRHDGAPFDFRDLVGVLSIGQTTKTERQIGYFGVGFKSVFEVTERPRIESGHFAFEIVDISIPRHLPRAEGPTSWTTLYLPLKQGLSADSFHRRALEIEPTLLLNLPNLESLCWTGPDGVQCRLSRRQEGDVYHLCRNQQEFRFLVWRGRYHHSGPRPEGKPQEAQFTVAFPLDEEGVLAGTNLYSFLPIQEDSGLRFLLGSHFDVPVDRERLDPASAWNRGILNELPRLFAERGATEPERLLWLLRLLPLPTDRLGPLFVKLPAQLATCLERIPFLPHNDGRYKEARRAVVLAAEFKSLFGAEQLTRFVHPAEERTEQWLTLLGARTYGLKALLQDLVRGRYPGRLLERDLAAWAQFHRQVLQDPSYDTWESQLRRIPLFLDTSGEMKSATDLCLFEPKWQEVFRNPPPTVWPELAELPESLTLMASLRIHSFDWADLVAHLSEHGLTQVEPAKLFEFLTSAPGHVQSSILALPLYDDDRGMGPYPLTHYRLGHRQGLLVTASDTPRELFPSLSFAKDRELLLPLLQAAHWPEFGPAEALEHLASGQEDALALGDGEAERLLAWLLGVDQGPQHSWATLSAVDRLARLPVFESDQGDRRALRDLWRYQDEELARFLPDYPQLKAGSLSQRLVNLHGLDYLTGVVTLSTLVETLDHQPTPDLWQFLVPRAELLTRLEITQLLLRPLHDGRPLIGEGAAIVAEPAFVEALLALGAEVVPLDLTLSVAPLMKAAGYSLAGSTLLVKRLQEVVPAVDLLPELYELFNQYAVDIHLSYSQEVLQSLPLWLCRDGKIRSAREIPPTEEIAELLGLVREQAEGGVPAVITEMIPFLEVGDYLSRLLDTRAQVDDLLTAQPSWLASVEQVDRLASYLPSQSLCVDERGRLRTERLHFAPLESYPWLVGDVYRGRLLHPQSSEWQARRAEHLPALDVLRAFLGPHHQPEMRRNFYQFLESQLGLVVREGRAREFLLNQPIWLGRRGEWYPLTQLVLDQTALSEGEAWQPHPEIPRTLLAKLRQTLELGSGSETVFGNLLSKYAQDPQGEILHQLADLAGSFNPSEVRAMVAACPGLEPFPLPGGGDLLSHYAPPEGLSALAALAPTEASWVPFLRKLGLPYLPSPRLLQRIGSLSPVDGQALESLLAWIWEEKPEEIFREQEAWSNLVWMEDRRGVLKAPSQLYLPTAEIEELIGQGGEFYPARPLPNNLWRALGLRDFTQLEVPLVLRNLSRLTELGQRASAHFYNFLEQALVEGRINPEFLRSSVGERPFIWVDEGEYRAASEVLTFPAYRYFGPHRGTWERADERYPELVALFGLPTTLEPSVVLRFLDQVAGGIYPQASLRLLRNSLAFLAQNECLLSPEWKVLPARELPGFEEVLVAAHQPGVFTSNSPTLASLFSQGGKLWILDTEDPEHGENLKFLYQRLGVRNLRDSYTVEPDSSGRDVTPSVGESVAHFRRLLSAIYRLLPRLRAARPDWNEGEWLAESQLLPFTTAAPIRVVDHLVLLYRLPGVAQVEVNASLAFDPHAQRLLVAAAAIESPTSFALELAKGLSEAIYQGPGAESMVDLLNLLLLLGEEDTMNGYLDQRHFPRPFAPGQQELETWRQRLGEVLDFGLHRVLERRFSELQGANWEAWRAPSWRPKREHPEEFLHQVGVPDPSLPLLEALSDLLAGRWSLSGEDQDSAVEARPEPVSREPVLRQRPASRFSRMGQKLLGRFNEWLNSEPDLPARVEVNQGTTDLAETYRHPPARHLLVSERALSGHDLFCLHSLCSDFDQANQWYIPGARAWNPLFLPTGRLVEFSGKPINSKTPLPIPLYARLAEGPLGGALRGPGECEQYHFEPEEPDSLLTYQVELSDVPDYRDFGAVAQVDQRLLTPTVELKWMPTEVKEWIEWARLSGLAPWQIAERATDFVAGAYRYDLKYQESSAVKELLSRPVERGENRFLSILHAGAEGRTLGVGVCAEFAALLLEVFRHCGVPSAMAHVWMLDQGVIHVPDHVIVLALVGSEMGPYWLPLNPCVHRFLQTAEEIREVTRLELLARAAAQLLPTYSVTRSGPRAQRELEERLVESLGSQELLETYLECLAKPGRYRKELEPAFMELYHRGLLEINAEELYQIWVKGQPRP